MSDSGRNEKTPGDFFAAADDAVSRALNFMEQNNLPGVVLARFANLPPIRKPGELMPWFELSASKRGLFLKWVPAGSGKGDSFYALLQSRRELSAEEIEAAIAGSKPDRPFYRS